MAFVKNRKRSTATRGSNQGTGADASGVTGSRGGHGDKRFVAVVGQAKKTDRDDHSYKDKDLAGGEHFEGDVGGG